MRVYLTNVDLESKAGKELLELATRIATDGRLDRDEIRELRTWLRDNRSHDRIAAVAYLDEITSRITADGVIDRDELLELFLAVERVIPAAKRTPIIQARKNREAATRERLKEARRVEREKDKLEKVRIQEEAYSHAMRLRHTFSKVAGVTFANDDGSDRQTIIARCRIGERLVFRQDPDNGFSPFATAVLRTNGAQLGYVPEHLAERICEELEDGFKVFGLLKDLTGGTSDGPTRGVNFIVFFVAQDVPSDELDRYAKSVVDSDKADERINKGVGWPFDTTSTLPVRKPWWKFW